MGHVAQGDDGKAVFILHAALGLQGILRCEAVAIQRGD